MYEGVKKYVAELSENDMSIGALLARGTVVSHQNWLQNTRKRNALCFEWRKLFKDFDVIVCPIMPITAFRHDHSEYSKRQITIDSEVRPYNAQFIWASIATLFGLPSTAVPIGQSDNGLPIGIQVMGDYLEDYTTIKFASLLESEFGGFVKPIL
jgi:amidase